MAFLPALLSEFALSGGGYNNEIVLPAFGQQIKLDVGTTTISFTPERAGSYPYSCWMGMLRNTITVVNSEKGTAQET